MAEIEISDEMVEAFQGAFDACPQYDDSGYCCTRAGLAAALAGRLLPPGGEVSTQTVWSRFGQSTAGTRQVITWPDGSRYVGPFVPDPPLTPEEIEAMRAVVWERVRRTLPNGGRPVLSETSEGESGG